MKTRILILSIFVLCFGGSFCSAKQAVLSTPAVYVLANDTIFCFASNLTDAPIEVTIQLIDAAGIIALDSGVLPLNGNRTVSVNLTSPSEFYRCRITGAKATKARGEILLFPPGVSQRPYLSVPAN